MILAHTRSIHIRAIVSELESSWLVKNAYRFCFARYICYSWAAQRQKQPVDADTRALRNFMNVNCKHKPVNTPRRRRGHSKNICFASNCIENQV